MNEAFFESFGSFNEQNGSEKDSLIKKIISKHFFKSELLL